MITEAVSGLIQGIVGAGANLFQTQTNRRVARENQDAQNRANQELAKYEFDRNLEMWNKGNAYNAPEAQMERLKKAGLNPNLVYGNGAQAGSAGQLPKYNAPQMERSYLPPIDLPGMIGMFQDIQIKQAQVDNLKAQRESRGLANQFAEGSMWDRLQTMSGKRVNLNQKIDDMANKLGISYELAQQQLEFATGKNRAQKAQINKMIQDTEYKKLQTDWFLENTITNLVGKGVGMMGKLLGAGAKGVRGSLRTGKTINPYQYDKGYEAYQGMRRQSYFSKLKDRGFYD